MHRKIMTIIFIGAIFGTMPGIVCAKEKENALPSLKDAMNLSRHGKTGEAIDIIKKLMAQSTEENNIDAQLALGFVYFKAKQYDAAVDEFKKSIAVSKDNLMALYFTGLIYEKKAKAGDISPEISRELKEKALESWKNYLAISETAKIKKLHKHLHLTKKESIKRAKKHIAVLKGELENEKK